MGKNVHIVFSKPPDRISDEDFNRWYDPHLDEILVVPGFVSARRFRMEPAVKDPAGGAVPWRYLSLYEIEDDVPKIMAELDDEASGMKLPEWFPEITFASWNCIALGDKVESRG